MGTGLRNTERLWGTFYALLHFLVIPELIYQLSAVFRLPFWVQSLCIITLNALFSLFIYRHFLWSSWKNGFKQPGRLFLVALLGLAAYYGAAGLYQWLISTVFPGYANRNDQSVSVYLTDGGFLAVLAVVLAAPIGEECIFRGLILRGLYDRSPAAAWCVSIGLFSLVHVTGYIGLYSPAALLTAFIQYIPAGICLALAYRLSGTILCPIFMHILINLTGVVFTLL